MRIIRSWCDSDFKLFQYDFKLLHHPRIFPSLIVTQVFRANLLYLRFYLPFSRGLLAQYFNNNKNCSILRINTVIWIFWIMLWFPIALLLSHVAVAAADVYTSLSVTLNNGKQLPLIGLGVGNMGTSSS
jgi:hypothetical protein